VLTATSVQAIAAAAISSRLSLRQTVAAGSVTSAVVLVLSASGLLHWVTRVIPVPVIKGIQFGAGLSLVISAGSSLLGPRGWLLECALDNNIWAMAAFLLLITTQKRARFPYALVVFVLGLVFAFVILLTDCCHDGPARGLPWFRIWQPFSVMPYWTSDAIGMGIAQLPLTTLNSVIAASALAAELTPELPTPSVTALGLSVAAMNLSGCWFGAMPVCHGAGGLAAQYRFGARSGASIIMLGLFKIVLGVLFGETLLDLLKAFPNSLLGIMVIAAGLELAKVGQSLNHGATDLWESSAEQHRKHRDLSDTERSERWTVMLMTVAGIIAFKNDAVGFLAGMCCHLAYRISDRLERRSDTGTEAAPLLHS
jgi:MFS superfamily sulfate permease-like transporter